MVAPTLRHDERVWEAAPDSGRAVVLVDAASSGAADELAAHRPGLDVRTVPAGESAWAAIAGLGPVQLLLDDVGRADSALRRFRRHFLLLDEGGVYLAPPPLADELAGLREPQQDADESALAAAMAPPRVTGGFAVVRRRGRTLVKLRESETTAALAADPDRGLVVAELGAAAFDSRCDLRAYPPAAGARVCPHYEAPSAVLRLYRDAACAPHSVVTQRGAVLVDSFRHHPQKSLKHEKLVDVGRRHVAEPEWAADDLPVLPGAWYHLDNEHRGHFGHVLTEQVARMWAWDQAARHEPELRVLVGVNRNRTTLAGWEQLLLESAGIDLRRVTVIDRPVRVERLLAATSMYSMPYYVHPRIAATWDRIGAALRDRAPERSYPRRMFCSRKIKKRACHNAREVEALFARHGFEVVFPEDFPLPEQAAMFHEAEVVAGFAGSALFNVMFTDRPKHVIAVASETYTPRNEYLISALRGHRLDMTYSKPDRTDPKFQTKRFMSSFRFDVDREGRWLQDEVLAHL